MEQEQQVWACIDYLATAYVYVSKKVKESKAKAQAAWDEKYKDISDNEKVFSNNPIWGAASMLDIYAPKNESSSPSVLRKKQAALDLKESKNEWID